MACLATRHEERAGCVRPTSAFPLLNDEYPRLTCYRHLFEAYASPLTRGPASAARRPVNPAFHDARFASADLLGLAHELCFARSSQSGRASDASVAPLAPSARSSRAALTLGRQDCFLRLSVKIKRCPQSEAPSFAGEHPRACASCLRSEPRPRGWFRCRPTLGVPSRAAP